MPVAEVAEMCARSKVSLFLDAAQSAGVQPIMAEELGIGMLACSGHKALLGPAGVGILYVRPDLDVLPLMEGGTGSRSEELEQPEFCPDRYESGTPNLPGLAGLCAGIDYILETGLSHIRNHEIGLAHHLENELSEIPGVRVFEPQRRGSGAVSFIVEGMNPADTGSILDQAFDIAVRTGLHCAPLAHQALGTFPEGSVRVSPGFSTTIEDVRVFFERTALDRYEAWINSHSREARSGKREATSVKFFLPAPFSLLLASRIMHMIRKARIADVIAIQEMLWGFRGCRKSSCPFPERALYDPA